MMVSLPNTIINHLFGRLETVPIQLGVSSESQRCLCPFYFFLKPFEVQYYRPRITEKHRKCVTVAKSSNLDDFLTFGPNL